MLLELPDPPCLKLDLHVDFVVPWATHSQLNPCDHIYFLFLECNFITHTLRASYELCEARSTALRPLPRWFAREWSYLLTGVSTLWQGWLCPAPELGPTLEAHLERLLPSVGALRGKLGKWSLQSDLSGLPWWRNSTETVARKPNHGQEPDRDESGRGSQRVKWGAGRVADEAFSQVKWAGLRTEVC